MAIGDAAAAAGLQVFASSQNRSLGYQNDNVRGDDIAANMARTTQLEANDKKPWSRLTANSNAVSGLSDGQSYGLGETITIPAKAYARDVLVTYKTLCTASANPGIPAAACYADIFLRVNGGNTARMRLYGLGSVSDTTYVQVAANQSVSLQMVATVTGGVFDFPADMTLSRLEAYYLDI